MSRLLPRRGAVDSLTRLQDWVLCALNNFFTVFLMPFCQQPVSCIKRGPQTGTTLEKLLFPSLQAWDHPVAWTFARGES